MINRYSMGWIPDYPPSASPDAVLNNASLSGSSFESYFKLFCLAFGFGFGFDALVLETAQWARFFRTAKKAIHHNSSHHGHE